MQVFPFQRGIYLPFSYVNSIVHEQYQAIELFTLYCTSKKHLTVIESPSAATAAMSFALSACTLVGGVCERAPIVVQ